MPKICWRCSTQAADDASFCPKCGASLQGPQAQPSPSYREYRHEKHEKREKEEKHEKGREGDVTGAIVGGTVLIWLGFSFYLSEMRYIPSESWWAYFLVGLGAILIVHGVVRYLRYGRSLIGSFIAGAILMLIGLSSLTTVTVWPFVLVVIGVAVIVSGIVGRRRTPEP